MFSPLSALSRTARACASISKIQRACFSSAPASLDELVAEYRDKDARVMQRFRENAMAFCNINPTEIEWRQDAVGTSLNGQFFSAYRKGENRRLIYHSPFSNVAYASVGPDGNLGRLNYKTQQPLDDPAQAAYEIVLNGNPLIEGEGRNEMFYEFVAWMRLVEESLAKFLAANLQDYPIIKKKLARVDKAALETAIADSLMSVKLKYDELQEPIPNSENIKFKTKMYNRASGIARERAFNTEQEQRMYDEQKLVKYKLKTFDAKGQPLTDIVRGQSVVSVSSTLAGTVSDSPITNSGVMMRRSIATITRYRPSLRSMIPSGDGTDGSPFGSLV